jgi:eukaryotic-like serine/threonine-protein kinase
MSHNTPSLDGGAATLRAPAAELPGAQLEDLVRLDRYEPGPLIGKGGMGEVRACRDTRLHRHIALKTATTKDKAELSRFVREAQVQGMLEHPGIVPVHELGMGADGAPYFAMKRVHGHTLFDVLEGLAQKDAETLAKYPRRKLLRAFLSVCQAVDYAHTHGWLHRDLKPANVMLGDFGEVYVLDWGLARRIDEKDAPAQVEPLENVAPGLTTPGSLMGTPGYMAPEQVNGQSAGVRSDVYALGAILFELLTHQMLANGTSTVELLLDTRNGCDAKVRSRAPHMDVAPELESVCVKAAHKEPAQRFASVREVHEAVDRVLAGERDQELRLDLARQHTEAAQLAIVRGNADDAKELEHRQIALRELGQALALDPNYRPALETMLELMQTPVKRPPPEAEAELQIAQSTQLRAASRSSSYAFTGIALLCAPTLIHGVHHAWSLALIGGLFALAALAAGWAGWGRRSPNALTVLPAMVLSNVAIASTFIFDGPLTILPAFAAVNALAFAVTLSRKWRRVAMTLGVGAVFFPALGSWFGLLPESFRYVKEGLLLVPVEMDFSPAMTTPVLLISFAGTIIVSSLVVGRMRDTLGDLMRRRALQAWNLKQLLPSEVTASRSPELESRPGCVAALLAPREISS